MHKKILVVDDQKLPRQALCNELLDAGFDVDQAADGVQGWRLFHECEPDVVVTDLSMPRSDGIELLSRIHACSDVPVILFSAYGTVQTTAAAFKAGAHDFLSSTEIEIEDLVVQIKKAIELGDQDVSTVASEIRPFFAGQSAMMNDLRGRLSALAGLHIPVFILGLPGSGRDQAFHVLHDFGHTEGEDFAIVQHDSPIPDFDSLTPGSIYLDGLETFSDASLEEWSERINEIEKYGFHQAPRIFASSAQPLAHCGADPLFRHGLGRHLLPSAIELPALEHHREDLPEIAQALCRRISRRIDRSVRLSQAALEMLCEQFWPGQVREIERVLERAIAFSRGAQVRRESLRAVLAEHAESVATYRDAEAARERSQLIQAIREAGGNISKTADRLGKSRSAIYRMIERHGITLERKASS
ncbi:MAG: response regulator [Myxococcota bacterium]